MAERTGDGRRHYTWRYPARSHQQFALMAPLPSRRLVCAPAAYAPVLEWGFRAGGVIATLTGLALLGLGIALIVAPEVPRALLEGVRGSVQARLAG
jgi:hypothetical protein